MKIHPKISVIVPNYNHAPYLKERIDSILNQTFQDFEIILLDDYSTDSSREVLNLYKDHPKVSHILFNEKNSGLPYKQWAKGMQSAKGEYIWIAESDDTSSPSFLEEALLPFSYDNQISISYCQSTRMDEWGNIVGNWLFHTQSLIGGEKFENNFLMDGNSFIINYLIYKNTIPNVSGALIKNDELIEKLDIPQHYLACGDWLFYMRILLNKKIYFTSKALNNFRFHNNSAVTNTKKKKSLVTLFNINKEMKKYFLKYIQNENKMTKSQIEIITKNYKEGLFIDYSRLFFKFLKNRQFMNVLFTIVSYPKLIVSKTVIIKTFKMSLNKIKI